MEKHLLAKIDDLVKKKGKINAKLLDITNRYVDSGHIDDDEYEMLLAKTARISSTLKVLCIHQKMDFDLFSVLQTLEFNNETIGDFIKRFLEILPSDLWDNPYYANLLLYKLPKKYHSFQDYLGLRDLINYLSSHQFDNDVGHEEIRTPETDSPAEPEKPSEIYCLICSAYTDHDSLNCSFFQLDAQQEQAPDNQKSKASQSPKNNDIQIARDASSLISDESTKEPIASPHQRSISNRTTLSSSSRISNEPKSVQSRIPEPRQSFRKKSEKDYDYRADERKSHKTHVSSRELNSHSRYERRDFEGRAPPRKRMRSSTRSSYNDNYKEESHNPDAYCVFHHQTGHETKDCETLFEFDHCDFHGKGHKNENCNAYKLYEKTGVPMKTDDGEVYFFCRLCMRGDHITPKCTIIYPED